MAASRPIPVPSPESSTMNDKDPLLQSILNLKELQRRMDILDERKKELQKEIDQLRLHDIPNEMAARDTTSLKGEWGRCTLTSDLSVSAGDKGALHSWLKDNGHEDLIVPTVNSSTLRAWVKEQLVAGNELPGTINIAPFSRAVLYKA